MARKKQNSSIALPNGRKRTLSPGFFQDPDLLSLVPLDRILFEGLWCYADKSGRLLDKPIDLKIRILPCDNHDVDAALNRLAELGLVKRYKVGDLRIIALKERSWTDTQRIHPNEPDSALPPPSRARSGGYGRILEHQNPPLIPHSEPGETPILSPGSSGPAGPAGSSGPAGKELAVLDHQNPKRQPWHVELYGELQAARARRMEALELDAEPDEKPEWPMVHRVLERVLGRCAGDEVAVAEIWDAYLRESWPTEKSPPYPFRVFASEATWAPLLKKREEAA